MRITKIVVLVMLAAMACAALAQGNVPSAAAALNILSPKSGERINTDFVTVKYELAPPASAASTPTFQLRLDSHDPIHTTDTQYTFTGLAAGTHSIRVQVVDANNMPIPGAQNQVQFTVLGAQNRGAPASPQGASAEVGASQLRNVSLNQQEPATKAPYEQSPSKEQENGGSLPASGSPLPLLSVIGMGVLVGGIASALRTRHSRGPSR